MNLLTKFRGDCTALPPRPAGKAVTLAFVGGFLAIAIIALLAQSLHVALVLGSFGASCVLVFGHPDVPFSQPRNVIVGHVLSTVIGLAFVHFCGPHWWSVALAVGSAIAGDDDHAHGASSGGLESGDCVFDAAGLGFRAVSDAERRGDFGAGSAVLSQSDPRGAVAEVLVSTG